MTKLPADFDPVLYLKANPDVAEAGLDASAHYLQHGYKENRRLRPDIESNDMAFDIPRLAPGNRGVEYFTFDDSELAGVADELHESYTKAAPFPHVVIDGFLPDAVAHRILADFPPKDSPIWLDWRKRDQMHQPKKLGIGSAHRLHGAPPYIQHILFAFNSFPIIAFLQKLTGIEGLIPDPYYVGGGMHQILSGGKLDVHADFNFHEQLKLYRRINLLLYLNENWRPEYGGNLELWNAGMTHCVKSIAPLFNRCVIFNTDKDSNHGHPHPLRTPEAITRKSLALYYYTCEPHSGDVRHRHTDWKQPTSQHDHDH